MLLNSGIQTYQILTNDDEVCIPSLSSIILLAVSSISKQKIQTEEAMSKQNQNNAYVDTKVTRI